MVNDKGRLEIQKCYLHFICIYINHFLLKHCLWSFNHLIMRHLNLFFADLTNIQLGDFQNFRITFFLCFYLYHSPPGLEIACEMKHDS